jgi:hypothetical protein
VGRPARADQGRDNGACQHDHNAFDIIAPICLRSTAPGGCLPAAEACIGRDGMTGGNHRAVKRRHFGRRSRVVAARDAAGKHCELGADTRPLLITPPPVYRRLVARRPTQRPADAAAICCGRVRAGPRKFLPIRASASATTFKSNHPLLLPGQMRFAAIHRSGIPRYAASHIRISRLERIYADQPIRTPLLRARDRFGGRT